MREVDQIRVRTKEINGAEIGSALMPYLSFFNLHHDEYTLPPEIRVSRQDIRTAREQAQLLGDLATMRETHL